MQLLKWLSVTDRFYKNLFGQTACPLWNQQQSIYVLNQNLSFARYSTRFFVEYVLCSSKQYCTDGCDIGKAGNDYTLSQ